MTAIRPPLANPKQTATEANSVLDVLHVEITADLIRKEMIRRNVNARQLASTIDWKREGLSRWFAGKRELPVKYHAKLRDWYLLDPPADIEHGTAQQADVEQFPFPATLAEHLTSLPNLVARAMAERGIGSGRLGKLLGIPFFVVEAFINGRTTLVSDQLETLAFWLLDDGQPTFADRLEALVHELLNPPPPEPIMAPSLFGMKKCGSILMS